MARSAKVTFAMFAGAAALAMCGANSAGGQQLQQAQSASGPPTEAQIAASPAAKRLNDLLQVMNSGDAAATRAYVMANSVDPTMIRPGTLLAPVGAALDLYRRTGGLDFVRFKKLTDAAALATVRERLTGYEETLGVKIEPQAPHRITSIDQLLGTDPAPVLSATSEQEQLQQIRSMLNRLADADVFSGVVIIARDGKPVLSQAYGYADREKKIRNRIDTPFLLGSMNKIFTGLAIGQLVEQGKLSYEDALSKFLPNFPDPESAKRIKIKHLLSHTSGLGDFFTPAFFEAIDHMRTVQSVIDVADKNPPKFEPGTKWSYSNLGFQLLGRVIEIVAGEDYFDYMQKNVFAPAGLKSTSFPDYDRDPVAIAQPYEIEFDEAGLHYVNQLDRAPRRGGPAGNGISTAPDLITFDNALRAGRIVTPMTFRLHSSPKPELSSPDYGYGFTTSSREVKGRPLVGHDGALPGECTQFGELRDTPYTIAILSNSTIYECHTVTGKILQILSPTQAPAP